VLLCGTIGGRLAEVAGFARVAVFRPIHLHRPDETARDLAVSLAQEHIRSHPRFAREWARAELARWVRAAHAPEVLSERQREVIALIALGLTQGEVATELGIQRRTVEMHLVKVRECVGTARHTLVLSALRDAVASARRHPTRPRLRPDRATITTPWDGRPIPSFDPHAGDY